jgi:hypothetical protein
MDKGIRRKINFKKKKKENGKFKGRCAWLLLHWKFATLQLSMYWFDDRMNRFGRIGGCNFMWSESSSEVSNWLFCLCMPSTLHKYKCARQCDLLKDVSGFSSFGRLKTCRSIYCSSRWSRTIDREGSSEQEKNPMSTIEFREGLVLCANRQKFFIVLQGQQNHPSNLLNPWNQLIRTNF